MRYLYSLIQKFIERVGKNADGLRVYMLHQVNDNKKEWKDHGVSITKFGFEAFIEALQAKGCNFLSVDDLSIANAESNNVIITFDDIFQDAIDNAIPFLIERSIPFCVFISDNYIDSEDFLSSASLKAIADEPLCTIGYHTKNHRLMRSLTEMEVCEEIDCKEFEQLVNRSVPFFSFPYGSVYACTIKSIKKAKSTYKYAFSTLSIPCSKWWLKKIPFFIPRINICEANYKQKLEEI